MASEEGVSSSGAEAPELARRPKLSVLLPIYNERDTLMDLLERVRAVPIAKEILLVDDASTDGTRELVREQVDGVLPDVRVIYRSRNGGKGCALREAIPHVRGQYVVVQDGDLEYDPNDYLALIAPMERGADIVYGSRFLRGRPRMRLPNRIINRLLAWMVRALYGEPITDEATCYKAFRRELLQGIPLACRRFEFCPEVTAKALRRGHHIVEVPIRYEPRTVREGKKIRWTDGVAAIWTLIKYRFWRG